MAMIQSTSFRVTRKTVYSMLLGLSLLIGSGAYAQQLPQLSQYAFNDYVHNPAVAGSRPAFELRSSHRNQWVGIQDAPRTFTLSAITPIGRKIGLGGWIYTDHTGPTRRTGMQLSFAYHFNLTADLKLSLALSGGAQQFLIDGSKITFHDGNETVIDDQVRGQIVPDFAFGAYAYHAKYWVGISLPQIAQNKVYFFDAQTSTLNKLEDHYMLMGGYRFALSDDFVFEPQALVKYVSPVPAKIDLTALIKYRNQLWVGATWRSKDAISVMLGATVKSTFQFGYSYDITTTNLNKYSSGTHEVMLAILFNKERPGAKPKAETSGGPVPAMP